MNTEQERAAFEAWRIQHYNYDDLDAFEVSFAFEAFKAGRAALQSQDRKDAERIDWLESVGSVDIVRTRDNKTEVYAPHNDLIYSVAGSLRAAIDHARRIEEES